MAGPLDGIRILDLTSMISGPMATMMLGDQGADVIKIEPPGGDRARGISRTGTTSIFLSANRNKRSVCIDLKRPGALELVLDIAKTADVFVQNFRPGAAERVGLGEAALRQVAPDIVYVSISGFGERGPFAHQRVYDPVIQALSGLADIQADAGTRRPRMVRTIIPDKTTALTAAQAITAALFARERGRPGQHVRLAMLDATVAYLWPEGMSELTHTGREKDPGEGHVAHDMIYETRDGYVTAGVISDAEWEGLCRALGREDWLEREEFRTIAGRFAHREERIHMTADEFQKRTTADLLERLDRCEVPAAPVLRREELLDHPQIAANELLEIHHDEHHGPIRQPRPAARFEETPASIRRMAPLLGADNAAVLSEIGLGAKQIEDLERAGIIAKARPPR